MPTNIRFTYDAKEYKIAKLTEAGLPRVLDGKAGMTFMVQEIITRNDNTFFVIVRDYRFEGSFFPYQTWSIDGDGVELL